MTSNRTSNHGVSGRHLFEAASVLAAIGGLVLAVIWCALFAPAW